jgi:hypothetical protein
MLLKAREIYEHPVFWPLQSRETIGYRYQPKAIPSLPPYSASWGTTSILHFPLGVRSSVGTHTIEVKTTCAEQKDEYTKSDVE